MQSLTLLQVYPLIKKSCREDDCDTDASLSSPVVKSYFAGLQIRILWDSEFSDENVDEFGVRSEKNNGEGLFGTAMLKVFQGTVYVHDEGAAYFDQQSSFSLGDGDDNVQQKQFVNLPFISLPSQDPTVFSGIPCVIRGYYSWTNSKKVECNRRMEGDFTVSSQTLVQIMTPIIALKLNQEKQSCTLDAQLNLRGKASNKSIRFHHVPSLEYSLFGTAPLGNGRNEKEYDERILSCFGLEIQRALVLRMKRLLSCPCLVGSTHDSFKEKATNVRRRNRLKKALYLQMRVTGVEYMNKIETVSKNNEDKGVQMNSFGNDVALTVYDDSHGSSKTALVTATARSVIKCDAVHVINGSTMFAKYGASGADIALESALHQIVASASIQALARGKIGSVCIILDQLDSFIPCSRPKSGASVEPSTPALNANVAFLNKLLHSLRTHRYFPFPTRNPYYGGSGQGGFLFPVKLCIIGIVTCDERRLKDADLNNRTILDILGTYTYRISTENKLQSSHQKENFSKDQIFDSVGGNCNAKKMLEDVLHVDERKRTLLHKFGLSLPTGVLLYGPPGTGKTLLAKATSNLLAKGKGTGGASGAFIPLNASDIVCAAIGQSEKMLASTFEIARKKAPSVIFIDEFQALFTSRDKGNGNGTKGSGRLASTLLTLMDDITTWRDTNTKVAHNNDQENNHKRVVVLAATNTPWLIDGAFMRSGRFDRVVHVRLPTLLERLEILKVHVSKMRLSEELDVDGICKRLAAECEGYSGADLSNLVRAAASRCIHSSHAQVKLEHFIEAKRFDVTQPSSNANLVARLDHWKP